MTANTIIVVDGFTVEHKPMQSSHVRDRLGLPTDRHQILVSLPKTTERGHTYQDVVWLCECTDKETAQRVLKKAWPQLLSQRSVL